MAEKKLGTFAMVEKLKFNLKFGGLWSSDSSKCSSLLYKFYGLMIMVTIFLIFDLSLNIYVFYVKNVQEATENFCLSLTAIAMIGKVLNFKIQFRRIQRALRVAESFTLENDREKLFVDERISFYNKICTFFLVAANIGVFFICFGAILVDEKRLPILAWFPFDWKSNTTIYALCYTYQTISLTIQANLNVTLDLFSAYLMHVASIKLEILGVRLEKLGTGQRNQQTDDTKAFVKCIVDYQSIWK